MYRLRPNVEVSTSLEVTIGEKAIFSELLKMGHRKRIAIETYPGVDKKIFIDEIQTHYSEYKVIDTDNLFLSKQKIFTIIQDDLTEDQSFGRFSHKDFNEFFDFKKIKEHPFLQSIDENVIVIGVGAADIIHYDTLIYADITRWEVQLRYKKGLNNWMGYREEGFSEKLKRAYYFDWPAGDYRRSYLLDKSEYYIDATVSDRPKLIRTEDLRTAVLTFTKQPFRLVPYFDPGIWGGDWMQEKFSVGQDKINLAWSFDGVPEENSIIANINGVEVEMPAQVLVNMYPEKLLGNRVFGRYGRDFPIRFDFLDTMNGQNLSLQVHPTIDYAYRKFGAKYTQDESYYILDCKDDACVYLGVKDQTERDELVASLEAAQESGSFDTEKFVNKFPVKKHDHLLIPAGTVHSSGRNCVVLEISSTPNRFTFKLWDWGRTDLDGKPRPIAIDHGKHVINEKFDETFARKELFNAITILHEEETFTEEKTGLHELEAIETRRLTFDKPILQSTAGSVNMLNLVEGERIIITSPKDDFKPFEVFYGETFIIPEAIKEFILTPDDENKPCKVMKAYIR